MKIGDQIGAYVIDAPIAGGGMGMVYRAHHVETGESVALKLLLPGMALREKVRLRFQQEAYVQGQLVHPNIVRAREFIDADDQLGIAFDLIEGPSLEDVLTGESHWSLSEVMEIIGPTLDALTYAHGRGVVHRDLKPANILLDRKGDPQGLGIPRITDFGIAKIVSEDPGIVTRTGTRMGSVPFMAPEQFMGEKDIDARADVFAAGMIIWRLVTRRYPINPDDMLAIMHLYAGETTVQPLHEVNPNIPENFSKAVATAMQIDRERRFFDAKALAVALRSSMPGTKTATIQRKPVSASSSPSIAGMDTQLSGSVDTDLGEFIPRSNNSIRWVFGVMGIAVIAFLGSMFLDLNREPRDHRARDQDETTKEVAGVAVGEGGDSAEAPEDKSPPTRKTRHTPPDNDEDDELDETGEILDEDYENQGGEDEEIFDEDGGDGVDEGNYEGGDDVAHWSSGKVIVASCVGNHVEVGHGPTRRYQTSWDLPYSVGMLAVGGITHGLNGLICEGIRAPRHEIEKVIRACMEEQGTAFVSLRFTCGDNQHFYQFNIDGLKHSGEKYVRVKGWEGGTECPWVAVYLHEEVFTRVSSEEFLEIYMAESCLIECENPCTFSYNTNGDTASAHSSKMHAQSEAVGWDVARNPLWDFVCGGYSYSGDQCNIE